jgi:hypothetical protein
MRPEGADDGGYRDAGEDYDANAWEEFTPFRVGDAPSGGYAQPAASDGLADDGRSRGWFARERGQATNDTVKSEPAAATPERGGSWWTEPSTRRYNSGDGVSAAKTIGSDFLSHVQKGATGEVVERTTTWSGEERLTVKFGDYVEKNVKPEAVERRGWLG